MARVEWLARTAWVRYVGRSTTGLFYCASTLRDVVPYVIDFTIGYKGVQAGQIPSVVYKLRSIFLDGQGPPEVHMHIRKIPIKDVPTNEAEFVAWTMKVYVQGAGKRPIHRRTPSTSSIHPGGSLARWSERPSSNAFAGRGARRVVSLRRTRSWTSSTRRAPLRQCAKHTRSS